MKQVSAVSTIIGKSDGPTSVFLTGHKEKNLFRRMKQIRMNLKYKRKAKRAASKIKAEAHTMSETIEYMKRQYHAAQADSTDERYEERKKQMKLARMRTEQPDLLGEVTKIEPPSDFQDPAAVNEWIEKMDEQNAIMMERAASISNEIFPTDYHLFVIYGNDEGRMDVELDTCSSVLACSYTGDMKKMMCDIQKYYGVMQEDIDHRTDRYRALLACLSV